MDLLLRDAALIDGTGSPARPADVAVTGDRIVAVAPPGELEPEGTTEVVDLEGLTLAPGFIDIHTHYDAQILWDGDLTPSSWHGVTSVVMGNCGFGMAPTGAEHRDTIVRLLENVEGMSMEALNAGIDWSFETFPEYLATLERSAKRLNVGRVHRPLAAPALRGRRGGAPRHSRRARRDARRRPRGDGGRRDRFLHLATARAPGRLRPAGPQPVRRGRRGLRDGVRARRDGEGHRADLDRPRALRPRVLGHRRPIRHPGHLDRAGRAGRPPGSRHADRGAGGGAPGRGLSRRSPAVPS